RRDPARRGLRRRAAARTAIGQGDHATWRRDRRRDPAYAHADWLTPGVSREEWRPAVHLDSLRPRSDRRVLGYPGEPGVARSPGRFVTRKPLSSSVSTSILGARMPETLLTTTTFSIEGYRITEYKGLVRGIIVRSPTIGQGFFGGLKQIVGGQIGAYAEMCEQA